MNEGPFGKCPLPVTFSRNKFVDTHPSPGFFFTLVVVLTQSAIKPWKLCRSFGIQNLVPCHVDCPLLCVAVRRNDAIKEGCKRGAVDLLCKLSLYSRRNGGNRMPWSATPRRGTAENVAASCATSPTPSMLVCRFMCAIPLGELSVAKALPRMTEKAMVRALNTAANACVSSAFMNRDRPKRSEGILA